MNIIQDASLKDHSTMRLGGTAAYLTEIHDRIELEEAVAWAEAQNVPMIMIGHGSNIVWKDEGFPGLIMVNRIRGFDVRPQPDGSHLVTIGSGEIWDEAVARTTAKGLSGIEALSLIPGTAGATPVQNVGAYGQEIAHTLVSVEAFDVQAKAYVDIPAAECGFSYRNSRFKSTDRGRFFITAITLRLVHGHVQPPFYAALERYLADNFITDYSPESIRRAVIAIRSSKLPDPAKVANNGSFFANPVIPAERFAALQEKYPSIPNWPTGDGYVKIPAGWLVEQAGLKGYHDDETGMATWHAQALVLVNEHAKSTADLITFRNKLLDAVEQKFGIRLVQEPELLP